MVTHYGTYIITMILFQTATANSIVLLYFTSCNISHKINMTNNAKLSTSFYVYSNKKLDHPEIAEEQRISTFRTTPQTLITL